MRVMGTRTQIIFQLIPQHSTHGAFLCIFVFLPYNWPPRDAVSLKKTQKQRQINRRTSQSLSQDTCSLACVLLFFLSFLSFKIIYLWKLSKCRGQKFPPQFARTKHMPCSYISKTTTTLSKQIKHDIYQ